MIIQYINLENTADQESYIKSIIEKTASKLEFDTSEDSKLIVDIKQHEKEFEGFNKDNSISSFCIICSHSIKLSNLLK